MRFLGLCPCVNRAQFKSLYSDSQIRWGKAAPAAGARVLRLPVVAEETGVRLGYHWLRFPRRGWRAISPVGSPTRAAVSKGAHIHELVSDGLSLRCERASFRCARLSTLRLRRSPLGSTGAPSASASRCSCIRTRSQVRALKYANLFSSSSGICASFVCFVCLFRLRRLRLCFTFSFLHVCCREALWAWNFLCVFLLLRLKWNRVSWNFLLEF